MAQTPEPADPSPTPSPSPSPAPSPALSPADPVLIRRRRFARGAELGQRIGYLLFGLAIVLFVAAAITDLPPAMVSAIVTCLALGSLVLAPSIVIGYGVRAADRDDRERAKIPAPRRPNNSA